MINKIILKIEYTVNSFFSCKYMYVCENKILLEHYCRPYVPPHQRFSCHTTKMAVAWIFEACSHQTWSFNFEDIDSHKNINIHFISGHAHTHHDTRGSHYQCMFTKLKVHSFINRWYILWVHIYLSYEKVIIYIPL